MSTNAAEEAVLRHALARGFLDDAQVRAARARAAAGGLLPLLARSLTPAQVQELRAVHAASGGPGASPALDRTVAAPPPPAPPSPAATAVTPPPPAGTIALPAPGAAGPAGPGGAEWHEGAEVDGLRLVRRLGQGGMGVVFLAERPATGERFAFKALAAQADPAARERFRREALAMARVPAHPNVVAVRAFAEPGGRPYLVMDLVEGGDLDARLRVRGRLPWLEAADLVATLSRALAHVHAAGVLHRDLKPANVMFDAIGIPKLTDFGLARVAGEQSLTTTGSLLGSPAYMAPEQADRRAKEADARTDVYGMGALLYHALTGEHPFSAGSLTSLLRKVLDEPPRPPSSLVPDVPAALDAVVLKAMAKEPADRYASAEALAAALQAVAPRARPAGGRAPLLAGLGIGLLLGAGAVAAAVLGPRVAPGPAPGVGPIASDGVVAQPPAAPPPPPPPVAPSPEEEVARLLRALRQDDQRWGAYVALARRARGLPADLAARVTAALAAVDRTRPLARLRAPGGAADGLRCAPFWLGQDGVLGWFHEATPGRGSLLLLWAPERAAPATVPSPLERPGAILPLRLHDAWTLFAVTSREVAACDLDGGARSQAPLPTVEPLPGVGRMAAWRLLAASADGCRLAVGGGRREVVVLSLPDLRPTAVRPTLAAPLSALAWSPDGRLLACAEGQWAANDLPHPSNRISVWDGTGSRVAQAPPYAHVAALAFLPDGRLAACCEDRTLRLYDPTRLDEPLLRFGTPSSGAIVQAHERVPKHMVACGGALVSATASTANVEGRFDEVRVWDPARPVTPIQEVTRIPELITGLAADAELGLLLVGLEGGAVDVYPLTLP